MVNGSQLHQHIFHSVLKLFTGLSTAALIALKLTVRTVMAIDNAAASTNTHQLIFILYAKSCNHLFVINQATGDAIINAINTSFKKSFDNRETIPVTVAPSTLRMPI